MDLGEKIRQARLAAGLSQRQLCGEEITRNMLSLIEHGSARPSMKTLALLAGRLGKPMSYFLEEDARDQSELTESAEALRRAKEALSEHRDLYAAQLLEQVTVPLLLREKLLLAAKLPKADTAGIVRQLPSLDAELLLRAEAAMIAGQSDRCAHLLLAAEDHSAPRWQLLRGKLCMARSDWAKAAQHLALAEEAYPEVVPLLEQCFRELGDFKRAYEYACKRREAE